MIPLERYDSCPIFKASGQRNPDQIIDCKVCKFQKCLEDLASDYADQVGKIVIEFIKEAK